MPLYVRDETVNDLAERFASMIGESKTAAVRRALQTAIAAEAGARSLAQRVAPLQARARRLGLHDDGHDDKPLMDELSGGL